MHQRHFIQTMPQEIYDDLFYEQAVVDLTEIKQFLKCLQTPYFFLFFWWLWLFEKKKKSLLAAILPPYRIQITLCTLGGNAALTQTVIGMLLMAWKKITHSSSKHQQTRHRSGDLCISNTIRVGVGKRYFALAHWCIGWRGFSCESREDFTQFF